MGREPKDMPCEWCGDPSVVAIERERKIRGGFAKTGMFIYACQAHRHIAEAERVIKGRR